MINQQAGFIRTWDVYGGENFARLLEAKINDNEEIRHDFPPTLPNSFEYSGVAPIGSDVVDPVWMVIRSTFDANGKRSRIQFRTNVAWTDRALGWS